MIARLFGVQRLEEIAKRLDDPSSALRLLGADDQQMGHSNRVNSFHADETDQGVSMRILIAEDSLTQAVDLRRRLEAMGHEVVVTSNGLQAWNQLRSQPEPVLISDWMMPEMNGLDLCRRIRSEIKSPYTYVILLTAKARRHERLQGLSAGADDFLSKPIDSYELEIALKTAQRIIAAQEALQSRTKELERTNQELARLAALDELTGLKNQRGFQEDLTAAVHQAVEDHLPLALLRLELDHVERLVGMLEPIAFQEFLVMVADLLRDESRACDTPARISEHGFAVILPGLTSEGAIPVAETLRCALAEWTECTIPITASLGISALEPGRTLANPAQLLQRCETALAVAWRDGGNRVVDHDSCIEDGAIA